MRDPAFGLIPDFRAGSAKVRQGVVWVGKLVKHLALALCLHLAGQVSGKLHATLAGWREDQLGTIRCHRGSALQRQVVRHDQNHLVATHGSCHGKGNARVAAGRLDQRISWTDFPTLFGLKDHRQRRPVLDGSCRVVALHLAEDDVATRLNRLARQSLQTHQRGIAHGLFDRLIGFHVNDHTQIQWGAPGYPPYLSWYQGNKAP